ncbi:tRNA(fMet)-specific endonuclease VapC [Paraburkholderia graminis C4D1M]|jgi:predicted nucleic acid-binding protein|uniref:PilT protein domain protein n=1 Tax=Paraburkholderia graminis (strain ATCC 700544 / DSM 17151 / LMG 18924 / NCIMB 13744 / C4D1M) TaxID=396598 RepID=B1G428_PARG4|nr:PIN domain-containing protein [Paraburkholderia graminis]EDT09030.1 PilT protein domain protein [Paraburkholderia graminis C4D1M]CAB3735026.1 tRNA(fMet)-specific endonuclease VapC [Paraburkholderia graminis C4D1M]
MSAAEKTRVFLDSNVVLYLLSADAVKADRAESLLRLRPTISVQVLNEVTNVCVRKLGMAWQDVGQFLELVRQFCVVTPLTVEMHDLARRTAERYGLAFYDACIVAAASTEGCHALYTEDMHHGLIVDDSLTLRNPFA